MKVSAVLLAAGESKRMGAVNKLTLPINGEPLVRRSAKTLLKVGLQEIVCVLGHESERVAELLVDLAVRSVVNANYQDGQMTSVASGLGALQQDCDAIFICLADQPLLSAHELNVLIANFEDRRAKSIVVPYHQGQRGNPILLAARHRQDILAGEINLGCKGLIKQHPEMVASVEMTRDYCVVDMDTPSDYQAICKRFKASPYSP